MTLKIKDKNYFEKLYFRQFYITRKLELQVFFVDRGSGSSFFLDQNPGDPIRPDPDP